MNSEVVRRIQEAREQGQSELDLNYLGLDDLPQEIISLKSLSSLNLGNSQIKHLPAWFAQLRAIEKLLLPNNALEEDSLDI